MKNDDVIMLMDVGTCMTYSGNDITRELLSLVNAGMIGRFRVSDRGFSIKEIGIDTERRECGKSIFANVFKLPELTFDTTEVTHCVCQGGELIACFALTFGYRRLRKILLFCGIAWKCAKHAVFQT